MRQSISLRKREVGSHHILSRASGWRQNVLTEQHARIFYRMGIIWAGTHPGTHNGMPMGCIMGCIMGYLFCLWCVPSYMYTKCALQITLSNGVDHVLSVFTCIDIQRSGLKVLRINSRKALFFFTKLPIFENSIDFDILLFSLLFFIELYT